MRNSTSLSRNEQELTSGMCFAATSIVLLIFMSKGSPFSLLSLKSTFSCHDVMSCPLLKTVRVCESSGNVCTDPHAGPAHLTLFIFLFICSEKLMFFGNEWWFWALIIFLLVPTVVNMCGRIREPFSSPFLFILVPAFSSRISLLLSLRQRLFLIWILSETSSLPSHLSVDPLTSLCLFVSSLLPPHRSLNEAKLSGCVT